MASFFPCFVNEEENDDLFSLVTMAELEVVLKWFKRDKGPGLDGWLIEFYLTFFELIGTDLLRIIEDYRMEGKMYEAFNATFIALIAKTGMPVNYNDFRPISLCNFTYKVIAKIITNRIKPILSQDISMEQISFLENRQIHEAIGIAQEGLHSIKVTKQRGMIMKFYLSKAYDRMSWLYLRMILTHVGFHNNLINWTMCCLSFVSYSLLINGLVTNFFHPEHGLRKGFPLSPLLYLLVMEGMSTLIIEEKNRGLFKWVKIASNISFTHILSVDDLLIFMSGEISDSTVMNGILKVFCKATGMMTNQDKSTLTVE